jgi:hypothetical protein
LQTLGVDLLSWKHPRRSKNDRHCPIHVGGEAADALTIFSTFTSTISDSKAFVRVEVRRRKWLLPPFVRIKVPDPVRRNRLEVALWVFSLILPALTLRGTVLLLSAESTRNSDNSWILQK